VTAALSIKYLREKKKIQVSAGKKRIDLSVRP